MVRYRLVSTGESSHKYGNCEVCHQYCSEVFVQTKEHSFQLDEFDRQVMTKLGVLFPEDGIGWAHDGSTFGHESCLLSKRQ